MPEQKVLVREETKPKRRLPPLDPDVAAAWRWVGWFGLLLTVVGLGDFLLALYPLSFGSPEWEFGTVAATYAGLPLVTIGFAGLLGSAFARGIRWQLLVLGWGLMAFAVVILAGYLLFLTDVPLALRAVEGVAALGIKKAVGKTTLLALAFAGAYIAFAVAALRHLRVRRD